MNFKYRDTTKKYHGIVSSFGAGVQSTALFALCMYEPERIKKEVGSLPDCFIFANTQAEKRESLKNFYRCANQSSIPFYQVSSHRNALSSSCDLPAFTEGKKKGTVGRVRRQCTSTWKIRPIRKKIRELYPKASKKRQIGVWLGISTDEISRMKLSPVQYIEHIYPLIDMNLSRLDCYRILDKYGLKAVKSSCYMCPFQDWALNTEVEKAIKYEEKMQRETKLRSTPFLHKSLLPIKEVIANKKAQINLFTFDEECDGYCGL